MKIWRLDKRRYASEAFGGKRSLQTGGRWHRKGAQVAYASEHPGVVALERGGPEPFRWDSRLFDRHPTRGEESAEDVE